MGGHQNGSTGTKVITQKHWKNNIFKSFGLLLSKRVWEEPPFSIPDFILYVVRIIVLKFHGNRSTGTKVIAMKMMCLQTDDNDDRPIYDRKLLPTYRPRYFSACNQNHTRPIILFGIRHWLDTKFISCPTDLLFFFG
jgi:hypothetical protein